MSSEATTPQSDPIRLDEYHDGAALRDAIDAADLVSLDADIVHAKMGVTFQTIVETLESHDAFVMMHGNSVQPIGLAIDLHSLEDCFDVIDTFGSVGLEQMHYNAKYHDEVETSSWVLCLRVGGTPDASEHDETDKLRGHWAGELVSDDILRFLCLTVLVVVHYEGRTASN